jgi:epoxyqueuosine reductase
VALAVEAERLLGDASPLVRGAAVWALGQLLPRDTFDQLSNKAAADEADATVRAEWEG